MTSPYRDYATNDVPPDEDHDEPYSSGLWGAVKVIGASLIIIGAVSWLLL